MRRRATLPEPSPLDCLRRYDAADWGGGPDAPQRWYDARTAWAAEHGECVEPDPDTEWPDVPFNADEI